MVKKNEVKNLEVSKQSKLKTFSKILYVLSKIGKVIMVLIGVIMLLCACAFPFVRNGISYDNNVLTVFDEKITFIENEEGITLISDSNDEVYKATSITEISTLKTIMNGLTDANITKIVWIVEIILILVVVVIALLFMVLHNIDKFFRNIHENDTPFTLDNVLYLRKIAHLQIALWIIPIVISIVVAIGIGNDATITYNLMGIVYILIIYVITYIFEYGYYLQQDSKLKLYENVD